MSVQEDNKLDSLLRQAAPEGARPGFAESVVAATRARRRGRRMRSVVVGLAAAVALAVGLGVALSRSQTQVPEHVERVRTVEAAPTEALPESEVEDSFAVQFVSTGERPQRVMMARINGTCVISARPNDEMADELEELLRLPAAMAGSVSAVDGGAALAVALR